MRIVPRPVETEESCAQATEARWIAELDSALSGESCGPEAESLRELREDVRSLAPAMSADFAMRLSAQIDESAHGRPRERLRSRLRGTAHARGPGPSSIKATGAPRAGRFVSSTRRLRARRPSTRLGIASLGTALAALIVTLVVVGPLRSGGSPGASLQARTFRAATQAHAAVQAHARSAGPAGAASGTAAGNSASTPYFHAAGGNLAASAEDTPAPAGPAGASSTPGRLQQLAASITLTAASKDVQTTADRVGQLAASDGGFVQSSQVQVQQGSGEATLTLRLPSSRLGADLASLARLAPVRAERQSLQDITDAYDSARRQAADATAERQALLRALARASTQGQIESLHARLSQNAGAISRAHSTQRSVSRQAATATVEVTVLGDAHSASEGLSLHGGLHDASRVLIVVAVVLLIGAAVLVPLGLLLAAFLAARRSWLRSRRDRVLDAR